MHRAVDQADVLNELLDDFNWEPPEQSAAPRVAFDRYCELQQSADAFNKGLANVLRHQAFVSCQPLFEPTTATYYELSEQALYRLRTAVGDLSQVTYQKHMDGCLHLAPVVTAEIMEVREAVDGFIHSLKDDAAAYEP